MKKKKLALLERLMQDFLEFEDHEDFSIFTSEELGTEMDVLRGMHTEFSSEMVEVLGEYFFLPLETEDIWYFTSVFTIIEQIPDLLLEEMGATISRLNYYLPMGAFVLGGDQTGTLIYRYTVPVLSSHDEEVQFDMIRSAADAAFYCAEEFAGYLLLLSQGKAGYRDIIGAIEAKNHTEA